MICESIKDTVSESFRVADCRDCIGSVQGCEVYAEVERLRKQKICLDEGEECAAVALRDEVERLKEAWESAELRADDGWREVERLRKLCASRPKLPDLRGRSFREVDDATEAFYAETIEWEVSVDAAGRGEGE
jgi:hypothetical protein